MSLINDTLVDVKTEFKAPLLSSSTSEHIPFFSNVHTDEKTVQFDPPPLPPQFSGAKDLETPKLLEGRISNVTLPSRLDLLGRQGFKIIAAFNPLRIGNAVVGFAPVFFMKCCRKNQSKKVVQQEMFVLPSVFSRAHARMFLFLRVLLILLSIILLLYFAGVSAVNVGKSCGFGFSFLACGYTPLSFFLRSRLGHRYEHRSVCDVPINTFQASP
jgi:hypothetical protein